MGLFQFEPYDNSRSTQTIGELMLQAGRTRAAALETAAAAQARAAEIRGTAWAGAGQRIGADVSGTIGDYMRYQADAPRRQLLALQVNQATQAANDDALFRHAVSLSTNGDLAPAVAYLKAQGGAGIPALQKLTSMVKDQQAQHDEAAGQIGYRILKGGGTPDAVDSVLTDAVGTGALSSDDAQRFHQLAIDNPDKVSAAAQALMARSASGRALLDKVTVLKPGDQGYSALTNAPIAGMSVPEKKPDYTINGQRFSGGSGSPIGDLQPPQVPAEKPATLGSPADYITRYAKEQGLDPTAMTAAQTATALKRYRDSTQKTPILGAMNSMYAETDPKSIAAAIRAGDAPPDISQYGRAVQGAVASELLKPNADGTRFNLARAQREWKAQVNLNRTMNGSQQVRLDESIRSGLAMYDRVDALAAQWDGKGWGPLSRVNLEAARQGAKGPEAASLANQLTGQIGQLTSDVATIEQGGLTPTNESRAIAEKSMQDWWGKGTITAMTAQGRYNMQIRHLARSTQAPMTPGNGTDLSPAVPATPPGATSSAPPAGRVRARDPQGNLHEAAAGTALPPGWKLEK